MFSIIILTYNEESALEKCLESISWCDDIVILDSQSTDRTCSIAEEFGARVFQNVFIDFANQRNYAIDNVDFKYNWVFHLDADEHFNINLKQECEAAILEYQYGAFMVPSKMMLWNKWLKNSGCYPVYQMRFHKLGDARFIQFGHGQRESDLVKGLGFLKNPYKHFSFEKGITSWVQKHIKYAENEAQEYLGNKEPLKISYLFSLNKIKRRRSLKSLSYKLPARPLLKFCYLYLIKRGVLDGQAGYYYCKMQSIYEEMITLKIFEITQKSKGINS